MKRRTQEPPGWIQANENDTLGCQGDGGVLNMVIFTSFLRSLLKAQVGGLGKGKEVSRVPRIFYLVNKVASVLSFRTRPPKVLVLGILSQDPCQSACALIKVLSLLLKSVALC